jgi:hypothetical protein
MPRNGSGTYSLPSGNPVVTGTTISSTTHNNTMSDIATALTQSISSTGVTTPSANLPMGGFKLTGLGAGSSNGDSVRYEQLILKADKAGDTFTGTVAMSGAAFDQAKGADIASASTINLTTATGNLVHVTGTTTITAITIPSGAMREVVFDGALTLTHNATTLILPGGANITTAAGDSMIVVGDGSGNARVVSYAKASGRAVVTPSGVVLLATLTPTAAANVDALSTFSSSYDNYLIIGDGLLPAADDSLRIRFATGGSVDSGSNYYGGAIVEGNSGANLTSANTTFGVSGTVISAGKGLNFAIQIMNANDATNLKSVGGKSQCQSAATPGYMPTGVNAVYTAANAISGVRFYWQSGNNFSAVGKIRIYGYDNS